MTGEDASLINAFIAFCHTNLAHNQPDRFGLDDVRSAFHSHPGDRPAAGRSSSAPASIRPSPERDEPYQAALAETGSAVDEYNTGHRYLDEIRRTIFRCCPALHPATP